MSNKKATDEEMNQRTNSSKMDNTTRVFIAIFIIIFGVAIFVYNMYR